MQGIVAISSNTLRILALEKLGAVFNQVRMQNNMLKIKTSTVLTRNDIIKYWKLSIGMSQSSSANQNADFIFSNVITFGFL